MNTIQSFQIPSDAWRYGTDYSANGDGANSAAALQNSNIVATSQAVQISLSANALMSTTTSAYSAFELLLDLRSSGNINPWVTTIGGDLFSQASLDANYQAFQESPAATVGIGFDQYISFVADTHDTAHGQAYVQQMMMGSYGSAFDAGFQVARDEGSVWSQAAFIGRNAGYNNLTYRNEQFGIWAGGTVTDREGVTSGGSWRSYGTAQLATSSGSSVQNMDGGIYSNSARPPNQSSAIPGNPWAAPDSSWVGPVNANLQNKSPMEVAKHLAEALRSVSVRDANGYAHEVGGAIFRGADGRTFMSAVFRGPRVGPSENGTVLIHIKDALTRNPGLQLVATWHTHTNGDTASSEADLEHVRYYSDQFPSYQGMVVAAQGDGTIVVPRMGY
jgi:proteasome lid subunit RPN8/RPN11